jgi:hypothetical protein
MQFTQKVVNKKVSSIFKDIAHLIFKKLNFYFLAGVTTYF